MKAAPDIVFVTYSDLKQGDPDDSEALEILKSRGYKCSFADWRDGTFPFHSTRLTVLRSTWDYHLYHQDFMAWLKSVSQQGVLKNSLPLVQWNSDKRYLRDLAAKGISCVPTHYLEDRVTAQSFAAVIADLKARTGDELERIVVKPSIGLATFGVKKFDLASEHEAIAHINQLAQDYCVMVQPFLAQVEDYGERALSFIDGQFSHAIRKTAFQHLAVAGEAGEARAEATAEEIAFGYKTLATLPEKPLYARVDVIPDSRGILQLLELELVEPSLFLQLSPGAAEKFADAVEACLS